MLKMTKVKLELHELQHDYDRDRNKKSHLQCKGNNPYETGYGSSKQNTDCSMN